MSQRTDQPVPDDRPEFSNEYLLSLGAATAVVLLMIFVIAPMAGNPLHLSSGMPYLFPWVIAGGITIAQGLSEFSGQPAEILELPTLLSVLVAILLIGVVAPTLVIQLMRSRGERTTPHGSRAFYLFGLIVAITYACTVAPTGFISWNVGKSLREAQAVQRNKDLIINDLNAIATDVRQYVILPKRYGGGDGAMNAYVLPPSMAATDEATYTVAPMDDRMVVRAVSKRYDECIVTVDVNARGWLSNWSYEGRFQ